MPLTGFHPVIARWFEARFREPTPAQRRGWKAIRSGRHTLIAAPTGSGKTFAAFLNALDELFREGAERELPDEVRVVYVSPLKALSSDIHRNLAEPRREIRQLAEELGLPPVRITAAVRSGDTPQAERAAMLRTPPHILVTTPESLYLLLTAERSRDMLRAVRTVIVDEIHAVLESRRGAHLALSLERLEHVAGRPIQRIGLSATQKPIEEVARFLVGQKPNAPNADCTIVDEGHVRELDLALELPQSPLEAVMAAEVWQEIYARLCELIEQHRTTLIFVNTRRLAERLARNLSERLGEHAVAAHHGSLSKETRLDAEERLKAGRLKALVATASLELGIDIGHVDLVCQIASPRRIAALLQRVGRSGHTVGGRPKGRLFPLTRDDLIECGALIRSVRRGELDRAILPEKPLDVLAQQIVAEAACEDWSEDALFELVRRAHPYRALERDEFDDVVRMLARGFVTRRGRRGAFLHYDAVNHRLRGRKGARLAAITSGGAIPEIADYRVVLEPEGIFVGTLNEDFAVESMAGDVFQLGNTSYLILRIEPGVVRVSDAHGQPPGIPFWLGEAPSRSVELSAAVAELRERLEPLLDDAEAAADWLVREVGVPPVAAAQIVAYLKETKRILGVVPSQNTLVLERFFDEAGGMQLVLHAPYGGRLNRAWGLALRKRFCRKFNFELQAAATDEGLLLSLGPQHSFPLEDVFQYLHPDGLRDLLVQAVLDAPLFQTRWRWAATLSLAVLRSRGGNKVPPPIQRMQAEDLLAAVFPDAAACLENIPGDREVPDHPLVTQVLKDCLEEAMDVAGLEHVLRSILAGELRLVARDTPEPSPLTHEILNARPYAFLDDAPLEERRAHAVYTRRALEPSSAAELGALDAAAIERVREEAWPDPESADELHDVLLTCGFVTESEGEAGREGSAWSPYFRELTQAGRAAVVIPSGAPRSGAESRDLVGTSETPSGAAEVHTRSLDSRSLPRAKSRGSLGTTRVWIAAERLPEFRATFPDVKVEPPVAAPVELDREWERSDAIRELLRGRLEVLGPVTAAALADALGIAEGDAEAALIALEAEGFVLRGQFTPGASERASGRAGGRASKQASGREWCDRRLLARIHRYTLTRLRAEIEPVNAADFMRFLFRWQRVEPEARAAGLEGLAGVLEQLDGFELAAGAWEADVLPARVDGYGPELLDRLCLSGRVAWGRLSPPVRNGSGRQASAPLRSSPIAVFTRAHKDEWLALRAGPSTGESAGGSDAAPRLSWYARAVQEALARRGASFFHELTGEAGLLPTQVEQALGELAAAGAVTSDSFAGLRALLTPASRRQPILSRRRRSLSPYGVETAGRWSLLRPAASERAGEAAGADPARAARDARERAVQAYAWALLRRYGVVFRKLVLREAGAPPWRELALCYRRLEARGEIRGGRFVAGFSGEQFALPDAVPQLRAARREKPAGRLLALSAADPLNLTGIVTPGERIAAVTRSRILFRDGVPIAAKEAGQLRLLTELNGERRDEIERALVRRNLPPLVRAYLSHAG